MFSLFLAMKILCLCVVVCLVLVNHLTNAKGGGGGKGGKPPGNSGTGGGACSFEDGECLFVIGKGIVDLIIDLRKGNHIKSEFTTSFVNEAVKKYPGWSVAIVHNSKTKGTAIHQHEEVSLRVGTYGYDIFFVKPGKRFDIWRKGDGGYINWAFRGAWKQKDNHIWIE
jgi:hypothetical protein